MEIQQEETFNGNPAGGEIQWKSNKRKNSMEIQQDEKSDERLLCVYL